MLNSYLFLIFLLIFSFFVQVQAQAASPGNDYDGDGRSDVAVWRPSAGVWWILTSSSNFATSFTRGWGLPGNVPVVDQLNLSHSQAHVRRLK